MRAMILPCYGAADALKLATNVPVPSIADGQVLVRVVATSVNPADCKQRSGNLSKVTAHAFPIVLGQDFSGIVVRCGRACSRLQIGSCGMDDSCMAAELRPNSIYWNGVGMWGSRGGGGGWGVDAPAAARPAPGRTHRQR
jgi:NADPH:quinone reductase-like Zn-dependent oxidoreductase